MLPTHFPPLQTFYDYFRRLRERERGVWETIMLELNKRERKKGTRSYVIVDSQSV